MTETEVKRRPAKRSRREPSVVPAIPQVNLLPPEVVAARGLRIVRRWLGVLVVIAVVLAAGVVALAWESQRAAQADLTTAQADTTRLQAERQKYIEVPLVRGEIDRVAAARTFGMSTEIELAKYLAAISATAPAGIAIQSVQVAVEPPTTEPGTPTDPLAGPSVGSLTFEADSLTVPDTADWIDALNALPGLSDAWFTAAEVTEANGTVYYTVSATVNLTSDAYAQRFEEGN
ncbi:fimbrial assembly protein [Isoptericola sp. b441]|uniref:Fimbrial assembly protein n=1 Tax=Actinotalea lenta TaxID=3064654 RepID=A0ABT9DA83_9CELL|nr:fimbrial assembly protein [Isoptericola sp. b441]MDO8107790.1 fimbrial assembly protein [Isoptericola sp. b441]